MIVRHPSIFDQKNARNRARWYEKYMTGARCPDLRNEHQYRAGEWLALQAAYLRRGYRLMSRPPGFERVNVAKWKFDRARKGA